MFSDPDFPGRQPDEHAVIVLHRHWFIFVRNVAMLVVLGIVPLAAGWLWTQWAPLQLAPGSLYYLFLWILIYGFWLDYYLDVFIITNKRIVDIEQSGLFGRTVADLRLNRIQDVTSETKGVMATLLHYGNVYVQTAGQTERFICEHVAHPEQVVRRIVELTDKIDDRLDREGGHHDTRQPPTHDRH